MVKAKQEKTCYLCKQADRECRDVMVCVQCSRPFCRRHGDPQMDECIKCIEGGEQT
jgi:hypothetical protein